MSVDKKLNNSTAPELRVTSKTPVSLIRQMAAWSSQTTPEAWSKAKVAAREAGLILQRMDEPDYAHLSSDALWVILENDHIRGADAIIEVAGVCGAAVANHWTDFGAAVSEAKEQIDGQFDPGAEVLESIVWELHPQPVVLPSGALDAKE